jgi:hypothetical protein
MTQEQIQGRQRVGPKRSSQHVEDNWSAAVCGAALLLALTAIAALVASLL